MTAKKLMAIVVMVVFLAAGFLAANTQGEEEEKENPQNTDWEPSAGFIKFEGMDGESEDDAHDGWCDLVGFEYGITSPRDAEGKQTGRRIHDTVKVTKFIDKTTPLILKALGKDEKVESVFIHASGIWGGSDEVVYYEIELASVRITDYVNTCEDVGSQVPMETITLSYKEMTVTYNETDEDGKNMGSTEYTVDGDDKGKKKK